MLICRPRSIFIVANIFLASLLMGGERANLTVALQFDHSVSETSMREMKREFARIMQPAVTDIEWRMVSDVAVGEVFHELVVARFEGTCEADGTKSDPLNAHYLAKIEDVDGDLLPFPIIDCHALLGMLPLRQAVGDGNSFQVQRMLGRAMGRVLAHEVYHALLKTRMHRERGIAKAAFTSTELFVADLRFDDAQIAQLMVALSPGRRMPGKLIAAVR